MGAEQGLNGNGTALNSLFMRNFLDTHCTHIHVYILVIAPPRRYVAGL